MTNLYNKQHGEPTPPPFNRSEILASASKLSSTMRNQVYGEPSINLACAGELKAVLREYIALANGRHISAGELEALDQVLTKIARCATGKKFNLDNYIDGAAYFAIAGELAGKE